MLGAGVELRGVRNCILQVFTDRRKDRVQAYLPVVMSVVSGKVCADITLAVATVLENGHRRGGLTGRQTRARISNTSRQDQLEVRGDRVLKVDLSACFGVREVLSLTSLLLDQFIRH